MVYIIFLIPAQNIDCGHSLEPPHRGGSNEYPAQNANSEYSLEAVLTSTQIYILSRNMIKYQSFI